MSNSAKPIVVLQHVTKKYQNDVLLNDINLSIYKGECLAIMGKNSTGKSSLGNLIASFETPTSGYITYSLQKDLKLAIGLKFINNNWPNGISVKNVINLYCGFFHRKISDPWVQELIELIDFDKILNKDLKGLKSFQKQLFDLFLAVLNEPELLILDDLSNNLSFDFSIRIMEFLKKMINDKKTTIVIIGPTSTQIEFLCNRVIFLKDYNIIVKDVKAILKVHDNFKDYLIKHLKEFY